ncbi:penicillin-binding transpeptidase domain-containing protein [Bdellovibrio sp. HCB2-146]|uniref:penicillin-binding transpeptidase domain-containing protein n=1 Tax=Bdellovibrio sp. HCB2-146 TaxID=3394362 RepID=UPI0039BD117D
MKTIQIISFLLFLSISARADVDFKKVFQDRDACFLISDLDTGKVLAEYNPERCKVRVTPCSSFKVPAALMAFEKGILKDENQVIKWDGVKRGRAVENRDQTALTWMSDSVKWVTEWVMPQVGQKGIKKFLREFKYGNEDFSGGMKDAWVTSSLKISAHEQSAFMTKLWKEELPLSKRTMALTKKIIFIKKIEGSELYGKTGTGCLVGHSCMDRPDKMIGNFVGVLKSGSKTYVFAANASDLRNQESPAGPRLRETTIEVLKGMGLVPN